MGNKEKKRKKQQPKKGKTAAIEDFTKSYLC